MLHVAGLHLQGLLELAGVGHMLQGRSCMGILWQCKGYGNPQLPVSIAIAPRLLRHMQQASCTYSLHPPCALVRPGIPLATHYPNAPYTGLLRVWCMCTILHVSALTERWSCVVSPYKHEMLVTNAAGLPCRNAYGAPSLL